MNRRSFLASFAAGALFLRRGHAGAPFPVKFRQQPNYASLLPFAETGHDEFVCEKIAMEVEHALGVAMTDGNLPLSPSAAGRSIAAVRFDAIAADVARAVFASDGAVDAGWQRWRESLCKVEEARFFSLPDDVVRYEVRCSREGKRDYRVGSWRLQWADGKIVHFEPIEEIVTKAESPWFRDVTATVFEGEASFNEQLLRGIPYWRARLDPACGIDVYGSNGIAVADIDNDGKDEIYVCQPAGLPNRLFKVGENGKLRDISREAGLAILDDTSCALFVDFRNSGHQDAVLLRASGPMLFANDGKGRFTLVPDAFRFATKPQGSFTGMAAADYNRDGRVDLYLCCYVYFQSEAQYRYPVPYHDAQNGPPNFLFRNRLNESPGYFEDVTETSGMNDNNNRFSFAPAWCDYNGDGWPDLYVANDFGRNNLYLNQDGHFRDVAKEAGVEDIGPGMSAGWADYDGDGRPDLLVANMWTPSGQRVTHDPEFGPLKNDPSLHDAYRSHTKGNSLYRNRGDGSFEYTGYSQGVEMGRWSWAANAHDFDNDGTPEIYVASGMLTNNSRDDLMSFFWRQVVAKSPAKASPAPAYENGWNAINQMIRQDYSWNGHEPNVFYARRNERYYDFSGVSGLDRAEDTRSFAAIDFDGDGNLDVVLKSRMGPQVRVMQNACGASRKSIVLSLRGTKSNRDAIGARVVVDKQTKWLAAGAGYLSQDTKKLHFGLGARAKAEDVRVYWPSGAEQSIGPLKAGFVYDVTEGSAEVRATPLRPHAPLAEREVKPDNIARLHTTWLREPVPLPEKRSGPALLVVHAGETLGKYSAPIQALDLRSASADVIAAYSIFRRYLFDYRVDLETPLHLLLDTNGHVRRIYAEAPDDAAVRGDLASLMTPVPDARALPFGGDYHGNPQRDYYKIGAALLQAGYNDQALPYLEEMLRRSPDNPKALLAIGRVHLQAKRLDEARKALTTATSLDPQLPELWNELGGVEAAAGNDREALKMYRKALELAPDLTYAMLNAAETEAKLGNSSESERLYRRVLELDPKSSEATNGLGLLMAKQGRLDDARKLFQQAIAAKRDDTGAINNLGVLYLQLGQANDAIAAFRYGIGVAPDEDILYLNLGRTYVRVGEREKAREVMTELLRRKPDNTVAQRALKELEAR